MVDAARVREAVEEAGYSLADLRGTGAARRLSATRQRAMAAVEDDAQVADRKKRRGGCGHGAASIG